MATIEELFKGQKKDVYGTVGKSIIDSRGIINPPRGAALLASSPTSNGNAIGNQIGALVKGSANRPTDTIFENDKFISKPITLTQPDARRAIEAGKDYFVKRSLSGDNPMLSPFEQGTSDLSALKNNAFNAGKAAAAKGIDKLKTKLRKKNGTNTATTNEKPPMSPTDSSFEYYKPSKFIDSHNKKSTEKQTFTGWARNQQGKLEKRNADNQIYTDGASNFDIINSEILGNLYYESDTDLKNSLLDKIDTLQSNETIVILKPYGKDFSFVLPGTISGISEDITPEYTDFKYLGSPFKSYKYLGVERTLKFELKMYYTNQSEKQVMIDKLNSIKELTFPYDEITSVTYPGQKESQLTFTGNFVNLTIGSMYKDIFSIIDSLSISVEDNISWLSSGKDDKPYPSVINISLGFKIIEKHTIGNVKGKTDVKRFNYNFDGIGQSITNQINK